MLGGLALLALATTMVAVRPAEPGRRGPSAASDHDGAAEGIVGLQGRLETRGGEQLAGCTLGLTAAGLDQQAPTRATQPGASATTRRGAPSEAISVRAAAFATRAPMRLGRSTVPVRPSASTRTGSLRLRAWVCW